MRSRGFSLLEALVTLVILSMIATVLMQSLSQVLGLRERVLRSEREARIAGLEERWFRESVGAAVADLPGAAAVFQGDARAVRFLGLDPVGGGAAGPVEWRLAADGAGLGLDYREGTRRFRFDGLALREGQFRYLDAEGRWQPRWPPEAAEGGDARPGPVPSAPALPRAVELSMAGPDGRRVWLADVGAGPALPVPLRVRMEGLDGVPSP